MHPLGQQNLPTISFPADIMFAIDELKKVKLSRSYCSMKTYVKVDV
jgi:hypothetical protein